MERDPVYAFHVATFGRPSEYGYKDIAHNWVIDRWKPDELMGLLVEMGARYFMAMSVHHDNFDNWDSTYQPWNSVRVGPKVDIVAIWERSARQHGLRFGIGFHHSPARTWGQFMPVRYASDKLGPKVGVPYDGLQTILDGKGKWWEGMDPVDLYGPPHTVPNEPRRAEYDPLLSPFANQFMWRVDDAITKYHPDVIYFDEHAGDSQVDLGVHMGSDSSPRNWPRITTTSPCCGIGEVWTLCSTSKPWVGATTVSRTVRNCCPSSTVLWMQSSCVRVERIRTKVAEICLGNLEPATRLELVTC